MGEGWFMHSAYSQIVDKCRIDLGEGKNETLRGDLPEILLRKMEL